MNEALIAGLLAKIGGGLQSWQQPFRRLLATHEVIAWMKANLKNAQNDGFNPDAGSPLDQAADLFNRFVSGDTIEPPLPHPMKPEADGVYRFRTSDIRFDGWFPETCCFVIGAIDLKSSIVDNGLDGVQMQKVINARQSLQINAGAYLTGDYNGHL